MSVCDLALSHPCSSVCISLVLSPPNQVERLHWHLSVGLSVSLSVCLFLTGQ